jgi:hypothetical protein
MTGRFEKTAHQRLARYRALAARAREAAESAISEDLRLAYTGLAVSWEELGDQLRQDEGLLESSVPQSNRDYAVLDQPKCKKCGAGTNLVRRTPHPTRGMHYELQTFACPICEHSQSRDADWRGRV